MENSQLSAIVKSSYSYSDVLRKLGKQITGNSHKNIKKKIQELNLDITHFNPYHNAKKQCSSKKLSSKEVLVKNRKSGKTDATILRRALIESGREYKCYLCNTNNWNGKFILLEVHHLNQDTSDNRQENLEFVCPNCHSQEHYSNTYKSLNDCIKFRSKPRYKKCPICKIEICWTTAKQCVKCKNYNSNKTQKPNKLEFVKKAYELKSFVQIGKHFNVSDNAIRKWCLEYNLPTHRKEFNRVINNIYKTI